MIDPPFYYNFPAEIPARLAEQADAFAQHFADCAVQYSRDPESEDYGFLYYRDLSERAEELAEKLRLPSL